MKSINVLSLFDGISCGMETLNKLGIKVDKYYSAEIDKYAIEISSNNHPNIIQLGDVCDIKGVVLEGLPKIDLILAGSPCQGFSRAGSGLNFEHKESKLFFEFIRILNWIEKNYYEVHGEVMHLDKDILCKGNKIYSRDTCIFVPKRINSLFVKCDKSRGKDPIGVDQLPSGNYRANCYNEYGKSNHIGTYKTKEEAFYAYKEYKEKVIKKVIDSYEGKIPEPYYSKLKIAMYNYKVEIYD